MKIGVLILLSFLTFSAWSAAGFANTDHIDALVMTTGPVHNVLVQQAPQTDALNTPDCQADLDCDHTCQNCLFLKDSLAIDGGIKTLVEIPKYESLAPRTLAWDFLIPPRS